MHSPSVDIIVPVWNHPFHTRACLAAIVTHTPQARLIIVDNGSSRETELMLEEFSEPLGEQGLFITSDRNVGLIPAINMGLARSDNDYAVILRPHVLVHKGWLDDLLLAAQSGIASPVFTGSGAPSIPRPGKGCSMMETFSVSLSALAVKGELHMLLGGFDEHLDGAEWCLKDFVRRAWSRGYRTSVTSRTALDCGPETVYGSKERLAELSRASRATYQQRWGQIRHYVVYFGPEAEASALSPKIDVILEGARQGQRFTLLLHHRQNRDFQRMGWNGLHTGIQLQPLALLSPNRSLRKTLTAIKGADPESVMVRGSEGIVFPGTDTAIPFESVAAGLTSPR